MAVGWKNKKRHRASKRREAQMREIAREVFASGLQSIATERERYGNRGYDRKSESTLAFERAVGPRVTSREIVDMMNDAFKRYDKRHVEQKHPDLVWHADTAVIEQRVEDEVVDRVVTIVQETLEETRAKRGWPLDVEDKLAANITKRVKQRVAIPADIPADAPPAQVT